MSGQLTDRGRRRRGVSLTEALVACSIAVTAITVGGSIQVRGWRMLTDVRQDRLAIDELSNQLQRIRHTPDTELRTALDQLSPSAFIKQNLPEPQLRGRLTEGDHGRQVTVELSWNRPGRRERPLQMSIWRPTGDLR